MRYSAIEQCANSEERKLVVVSALKVLLQLLNWSRRITLMPSQRFQDLLSQLKRSSSSQVEISKIMLAKPQHVTQIQKHRTTLRVSSRCIGATVASQRHGWPIDHSQDALKLNEHHQALIRSAIDDHEPDIVSGIPRNKPRQERPHRIRNTENRSGLVECRFRQTPIMRQRSLEKPLKINFLTSHSTSLWFVAIYMLLLDTT